MPTVQEDLPPLEDFSQFIGQEQLKTRLEVHLQASLMRTTPLPHVLLSGPAGVGKSSLVRLIGARLGDPVTTLTMPVERRALIRALQMFEGGILFLDEIHAMPKRDQEILLPVLLEKVVVDAKGRRFPLPFLTVIAATTERDKLIASLHDRFPIKPEFEAYTDAELGQIVTGMAARIGLALDADTAVTLGTASGGVPRHAEEFIITACDIAVTGSGSVTAEKILDLCAVDPDGLTEQHRRYLAILSEQGGRAGQKTIEMLLQTPNAVLREIERLLLIRKYIEYSPAGRELTPAGSARSRGREVQEHVRR